MTTIERIIDLLNQKGIEQQKFATDIGVTKQKISEWKSGKTKSYMKYLDVIAKYFDVTTDYLLGKTETSGNTVTSPAPLNEAEAELLKLYRQLGQKDKNVILKIITDFQSE